jgi:hypothetical protein
VPNPPRLSAGAAAMLPTHTHIPPVQCYMFNVYASILSYMEYICRYVCIFVWWHLQTRRINTWHCSPYTFSEQTVSPVQCHILDVYASTLWYIGYICQYVWYIGYICQYVLCGQIDQLHEEAGGILTALSETFPTRSLAVPVPRCKPPPNPPVDTGYLLTRPAS